MNSTSEISFSPWTFNGLAWYVFFSIYKKSKHVFLHLKKFVFEGKGSGHRRKCTNSPWSAQGQNNACDTLLCLNQNTVMAWHDKTLVWKEMVGKFFFKKHFVMKWGRFLYQPIDLSSACLSPNIVTTTQAPFLEVFCGSTLCHIIFSSCHLPSE